MKQLTRELRRRLGHPEWARRIDDPVHDELQAIADHRLSEDPSLERAGASISAA
jgi:hypothetical protein